MTGKLNKSNVARLRLWKGRETDDVSTKEGTLNLIVEHELKKRGPGRPRKVEITKPQKSSGKAIKVSPSVVPSKKKGLVVTKLNPEKNLKRNRLNKNEVKPLRRSPRLLLRTAVT
jgi:hypothetical protein